MKKNNRLRKGTKNNMNKNIWQKEKLNDLCDILIGGTPSRNKKEYWDDGTNIWVSIRDLTNNNSKYIVSSSEKITDLGVKKSNVKLIPENTLIMSFKLSIGKVAITGKSLYTNEAIAAFKVLDMNKLDSNYLYYFLPTVKFDSETAVKGATLNKEKLKKIDVVFPDIKIQQRIALILSTVDEEIQKTDQIIRKTDSLLNGLMKNLLFGEGNIKKIKIKEVSEITSSKRIMVSDYVTSGVPFYRSTEIIKKSKNIQLGNLIYISLEKFNELKNKFGAPQKGDILVTSVGTIGDVYLVQDEEFYFKDGNLLWIRKINKDIIPEYLNIILSSQLYREKLNNIAGGSSQKALTIEKFESIIISVPDIFEQKRLIDIFSSINNKQIKNKELLFKLKSLKNGLMNDIFSQKNQIN